MVTINPIALPWNYKLVWGMADNVKHTRLLLDGKTYSSKKFYSTGSSFFCKNVKFPNLSLNSVCVCVCVCVCMCVCVYVCVCVHILNACIWYPLVCMFVCMHILYEVILCIYPCLSVCLSVCLPVCLSVCLPACLPACLPVCLSICM